MEIRIESKNGDVVTGIDQAQRRIEEGLKQHLEQWLQKLRESPESFTEVERSVHHTFQNMADHLVAGLVAQTTAPPEFAQSAKKK
jgi:hypothetical protein